MSSQGANNPGTTVDDSGIGTVSWTNVNNSKTSNDVYATCNVGTTLTSHFIKATNFGFTIPTDSVITGITAYVEGTSVEKDTGFSAAFFGNARIVKGGTIQAASDKAGSIGTGEVPQDGTITFGGSSDLWGQTLAPSDINASNFGVAFYLAGATHYPSGSRSVDAITITVSYSQAAVITNAVDFTIEDSIPLTITNTDNLYLKALLYVNGTLIKTTTLGQVTIATLTTDSTNNAAMYAQVPNATSTTMYVRLQSFSDSGYTTQVGSNQDKTGTASVNTTTNKPTFTTYTIANQDKTIANTDTYGNVLISSSTATLLGSSSDRMIQNYSKVRATITSGNKAVALNSATMNKYRMTNDAQYAEASYSSSSTVTIDVDNCAVNSFDVGAYDSRGLVTVVNKTLGLLAQYTNLTLFSMTTTRTNSVQADITLAFSGTLWKKYFSSNSTTNTGGGVLNDLTTHYRFKNTANSWTTQNGTFTVTIASPGLVTKTTHGFVTGDVVYLTTTNALPTGLSVNTTYYVIKNDANSFWLATSSANATNNIKINTSGTQAGTHTVNVGSPWTSITATVDSSGNVSFSAAVNGDLGASGFDTTKSFSIQVRGYDRITNIILETTLPKGTPLIDYRKTGIAIDGSYDTGIGGALQAYGNEYVNGNSHITGTETVDGNATLGGTLAVTSNTTVGGTLGVTGNTTLSGTLAVTGVISQGGNTVLSDSGTGLFDNAIINGNFDVWQRNTTFTQNNDLYGPDRWNLLQEANSAWTFSRSTAVPGTGSNYSLKGLNVTLNKQAAIVQILEGIDSAKLMNQTVSASFQAVTTSGHVISNLRAAILSWTGTIDAPTSDVVGTWAQDGTNPTWATSWTMENTPVNCALQNSNWTLFKVENVLIDTAGMKNVALVIWVDDGTIAANDEFYITQIQLNIGATAAPYHPRFFDMEQMLCERFYQRFGYDGLVSDQTATAIANGSAAATTVAFQFLPLRRPMRILPTLTATAGDWQLDDGNAATDLTAIAINTSKSSTTFITIRATVAAGLTQFRPYHLRDDGTGNRSLALDAEL